VDDPQLNVPIVVQPVDRRADRRTTRIGQHPAAVRDVIGEPGRRLRAGGAGQRQPRREDRQDGTEEANNPHGGNLAADWPWARGVRPRDPTFWARRATSRIQRRPAPVMTPRALDTQWLRA